MNGFIQKRDLDLKKIKLQNMVEKYLKICYSIMI